MFFSLLGCLILIFHRHTSYASAFMAPRLIPSNSTSSGHDVSPLGLTSEHAAVKALASATKSAHPHHAANLQVSSINSYAPPKLGSVAESCTPSLPPQAISSAAATLHLPPTPRTSPWPRSGGILDNMAARRTVLKEAKRRASQREESVKRTMEQHEAFRRDYVDMLKHVEQVRQKTVESRAEARIAGDKFMESFP